MTHIERHHKSWLVRCDDKTVSNTVQIQAGYWLHNSETVSSDLILIVPDGKAPRLKVRVQEFTD